MTTRQNSYPYAPDCSLQMADASTYIRLPLLVDRAKNVRFWQLTLVCQIWIRRRHSAHRRQFPTLLTPCTLVVEHLDRTGVCETQSGTRMCARSRVPTKETDFVYCLSIAYGFHPIKMCSSGYRPASQSTSQRVSQTYGRQACIFTI